MSEMKMRELTMNFMRYCRLLWLVLLAAAWGDASAVDISARFTDRHGQPVGDALLMATAEGLAVPERAAPAVTRTIDQKDETFFPYLDIFRPGDKVVFRNSDRTRHHVYSFAPAKAFEFVLAPGESSAPMSLERKGVVAAGCNIHDRMITYLYVTDAPWVGRSGADGRATITGLPPGTYSVSVWHPQLRPGTPGLTRRLEVAANAAPAILDYALDLLPDPRGHRDRERPGY